MSKPTLKEFIRRLKTYTNAWTEFRHSYDAAINYQLNQLREQVTCFPGYELMACLWEGCTVSIDEPQRALAQTQSFCANLELYAEPGAPEVRKMTVSDFVQLVADILPHSQGPDKQARPATTCKPKRRRRHARKPSPLTDKQLEAAQLVGEHKGNIAAAAKAAGKTRQAMDKLRKKALKKIGRNAIHLMNKTQKLPTNTDGQVLLADQQDKRARRPLPTDRRH